MNRDMKILLNKAARKLIYAVELLEASLLKVAAVMIPPGIILRKSVNPMMP